ncbi:MAG TPA: hypothetical protein VKF17_08305, partial [Isosphaeraceae bacterium]|nr:hypothetical protein [Isosphaeraceae bacterium]
RNYHQAMLRRRVTTGEPGLACGRLIRIARVAGKPGDHRTLIVAAMERATVRQITASVSIRQEPEHTRDQKQLGRGKRVGLKVRRDGSSVSAHCSGKRTETEFPSDRNLQTTVPLALSGFHE